MFSLLLISLYIRCIFIFVASLLGWVGTKNAILFQNPSFKSASNMIL
nr:MAG TPA: hypothetical protein [Caudoviricetes sp.]